MKTKKPRPKTPTSVNATIKKLDRRIKKLENQFLLLDLGLSGVRAANLLQTSSMTGINDSIRQIDIQLQEIVKHIKEVLPGLDIESLDLEVAKKVMNKMADMPITKEEIKSKKGKKKGKS